MERRRSEIWFEHPKRAPRSIKLAPYGKGLHVAGGIWGEDDWFESLVPDLRDALKAVRLRIAAYTKQGFVRTKSRIIDEQLARSLRLPYDAPKKQTASKKPASKSDAPNKTTRATTSLLERPKAKTFEDYRAAIKDAKRIWLRRTELTSDLRKKLLAHLTTHNEELAAWAAKDPKVATRARTVLPPAMLPKRK